ncbi:MAG: hypothetical protein M3443_01055, partial [Actinomycetota bacterium]|nr:hypothetical protein [Actinomycetota bacterium]
METVLLFIAIVLLWLDLDEPGAHHQVAATRQRRVVSRQIRTAEHQLQGLTLEAIQAMLDE